MRALSIKQPWARLIAQGLKDVENRAWPPSSTGLVLIHAGQEPDGFDDTYPALALIPEGPARLAAADYLEGLLYAWATMTGREWKARAPEWGCGALVGIVEIIGSYQGWPASASPWYQGPPLHGWTLRGARPFPEPVPWRGALGFFDVDLEALPPSAGEVVRTVSMAAYGEIAGERR